MSPSSFSPAVRSDAEARVVSSCWGTWRVESGSGCCEGSRSPAGCTGSSCGGASCVEEPGSNEPFSWLWQKGQVSCTYNHFFKQPAWKR